MSRVFVCGVGAVSPAGWSGAALQVALTDGQPLPVQPLERPGWTKPLRVRPVPPPASRLPFLAHPRLRRTSPITHYAAAAALEAVAGVRTSNGRSARLGVVVCLQSGCVQFSHRFFQEVLSDPATASPLLFPETVFAAPASHVAALLENTPLVYTLAGDPACFLQGLALGTQWLEERQVEACVVLAAEEVNWVLADALWHFEHEAIIGAGAGALCLTLEPALSKGAELDLITDVHTYTQRTRRAEAARRMSGQLPASSPADLLCDGLSGSRRADAAEQAAWRDWTGARLSPKKILGEGLAAAGAWQCVAACQRLMSGDFPAAVVSLVGSNQQAIGARFVRPEPGIASLSPSA
jgi:3-oxoacyl-(acyl-carrier-protein) synthase